MLHGVDVSGHQPGWTPDTDDKFVFVKATEGRTVVNSQAAAQLKAARTKGLQIGHYHFLWPDNAKAQAAWFVGNADIRSGDLLVCDWENTGGGHPSVEDAAVFIAEVERLKPGHRVGLYCNRSDWANTAVKANDFLWIAQWSSTTPTMDWTFWQYTDKPIDQNWAAAKFGSLAELKAWAYGLRWSDEWKSVYVSFVGGYVTPIDRTIVLACAKSSGWGTIRLSQGGLSTSVTASALTHAGLGVADIAIDGRSKEQVWRLCAHLIKSGIVAFPRGYGGDPWADQKHIHFVSVESLAHAHPQAQAQVAEWKQGGDGLKGDGLYNGPKVPLGTWASSPYNPANITDEDDMPTVNEIWTADIIPAPRPVDPDQPEWRPDTYLRKIMEAQISQNDALNAIAKTLGEILTRLPAPPDTF